MNEPARRLVVAVAVRRGDRWLAARRTRPSALAGRWELPGGKVEPGESVAEAARRELAEELGLAVTVTGEVPAPEGTWPIDDRLHMVVVTATAEGDPTPGDTHDAVAWVRDDELADLAWVPADVAVAARLAGGGG